MASNKILLTIAIPTFNRCEYLNKTIASIVADPLFNAGEIELVISDNCSDDNTPEVVKQYVEQYGNITYNRNSENIGAENNYIKLLRLSKGEFIKFYNDTAIFLEGTLSFLLQAVKNNLEEKPVLFFTSGELRHIRIEEKRCFSFSEFVDTASYYSTWISAFGIWESDFSRLTDIERYVNLQLWHTGILFRLTSVKSTIVYNQKLVIIQDLQKKGGYNFFEVFTDNYLFLYQEYLANNQLSYREFKREKKRLFRYFFLMGIKLLFIHQNKNKYHYDTSEALMFLFKHYKTFLLFYIGIGYLIAYFFAYKCWHIIRKII